jgi:hypothetical protein
MLKISCLLLQAVVYCNLPEEVSQAGPPCAPPGSQRCLLPDKIGVVAKMLNEAAQSANAWRQTLHIVLNTEEGFRPESLACPR